MKAMMGSDPEALFREPSQRCETVKLLFVLNHPGAHRRTRIFRQ